MAEFIYNNVKNANNNHIFFKLNCGYHLCIFYKDDINFSFKSKLAYTLLVKFKKFMIIC